MNLNLISIQGSKEQFIDLRRNPIAGLDIDEEGFSLTQEGAYKTGAYASGSAIVGLRNLGVTVEVHMNEAELTAHFEELTSQATGVPRPPIA